MLSLYVRAKNALGILRRDESGQDAFEYLAVIGVVMVAIVGAVTLGLTPSGLVADVITAVKTAVEGLFS